MESPLTPLKETPEPVVEDRSREEAASYKLCAGDDSLAAKTETNEEEPQGTRKDDNQSEAGD